VRADASVEDPTVRSPPPHRDPGQAGITGEGALLEHETLDEDDATPLRRSSTVPAAFFFFFFFSGVFWVWGGVGGGGGFGSGGGGVSDGLEAADRVAEIVLAGILSRGCLADSGTLP